MTDFEDTLTL